MSDVYKVVAPLVLVKDETGRVNYAYENALVRIDDEQAERFLAEGLVEESDVELDDDAPADDGKPAKGATKPVLVAWIAERVAKDDGSDYTLEELEAMKVPELRAIIDSVE